MRSTIIVIFGAVIFVLSLSCAVYAIDQEADLPCKNGCLAREGAIGKCANGSCDKNKDVNHLSPCTRKSGRSACASCLANNDEGNA